MQEHPESWIPHQRDTWDWRYGRLTRPVQFQVWCGYGARPEWTVETQPAGTAVKIVMVSRFGDVGITTDLTAEHGYGARVMMDAIERDDSVAPRKVP